MSKVENLVYSAEVFDAHANMVEVLARVSALDVALATFNATRTKHPDKHIALCRKAQILAATW